MLQQTELARHLAYIEDHLLRWHWAAWEFELTNTMKLYNPWSNAPRGRVEPNERVVAKYVLKSHAGSPVVFCLAELEADDLSLIRPEEEFHKSLAGFHASLAELPMAMYTHRGWVWDYANMAEGEGWNEDDPHLATPLEEGFVSDLIYPGHYPESAH